MILTCPSCATSYFTPDEAIGATGRRVRCKACAHIWHATLEEPLELNAASDATPEPASEATPASAGFGRRDDSPETLAETPAPELPKAFRARVEQQRRLRRAATHGAIWAGLASVFIGLIAAAWIFRVEVVELYPRANAAYAAVGSPVNRTGLEFEAVGAKPSPNDPDMVLVSGALRNVRDREIVAPAVRVALLDSHGAEIGFRIVPIDAAPVLPGGVQGFAALIPDPGAHGAGVGVDFVTEVVPAKPPVAQAEAHPPDVHPPMRRLPPAEDTGLRPALGADPVDAVEATPVHDTVPDTAHGTETALDSDHGEAVSPSHHG